MKKVTFTAEDVDFTTSNKIESVVLFHAEKERVLSFQYDPVNGAESNYIELDDQSFSTYNGVKQIILFDNKVQVKLNKKGMEALQCDEIIVDFKFTVDKIDQLQNALSVFFEKEFKLDPSYKSEKKSKSTKTKNKDVTQIRVLNLVNKQLKILPEDVRNMSYLEEIFLGDNPDLDLAQALTVLSQLPLLKKLSITPEKQLIPKSIGDFKNLETLYVGNVQIFQSIPKEIGKLKKIKELSISTYPNQNVEFILPDEITQLTEVKRLNISAAKWNLPANIGNLEKLESLDLKNCTFKQMPESIIKLKNLKYLFLDDTNNPQVDWADVLRKISQLKKLFFLQLIFSKQINTNKIPSEIGLCTQVKTLRIITHDNGNNVTFIPHDINRPLILPNEFWNLKKLVELDVGSSYLPQLPEGIGKLESLKVLNLSLCDLQSIPESIGDLTKLTNLDIRFNPKLTTLPEVLYKLKNLNIVSDSLTIKPQTAVPVFTEPYHKVKSLNLSSQNLQVLPEYISEMVSLEKVTLDNNPDLDLVEAVKTLSKLLLICELNIMPGKQLIPSSIGNLINVKKLSIHGLETSQTLPKEISKLKKLSFLDISSNEEIIIPDEFSQLTNLRSFFVHAKKWNLPANIGNLEKLDTLILTNCALSQMPSDILKLKNLEFLSLDDTNNPDLDWADALHKISQLEKVSYLGLDFAKQPNSNKIPAEIGLCKKIKKMRIFTGNRPLILPVEFGNLTELVELELSGTLPQLPENIGDLKSLKTLSVVNCGLKFIPESLGNLTKLKKLDLSNNSELTALPETIGKLVNLTDLELMNNRKLSSLPESIGNLTKLTTLELSGSAGLSHLPKSLENIKKLKIRRS